MLVIALLQQSKVDVFLQENRLSSFSFLQALWRFDPGREAESPVVLERLPGWSEPAVPGVLPLPLLCLHVPCHHLWGTAGGGDQWPHSEHLSLLGGMGEGKTQAKVPAAVNRLWFLFLPNDLFTHGRLSSPDRVPWSRCWARPWPAWCIASLPANLSPSSAAPDPSWCLRRSSTNSASKAGCRSWVLREPSEGGSDGEKMLFFSFS